MKHKHLFETQTSICSICIKHKHINIYTNTSTSRQRKYVIWTNCVKNWISDFVLFVLSGFSEELVLTCTVKVGGHEIMARFQERSLHLYIESSFYSNFQVRSKKKLRARLINRYFALSSVWFTLPDSFYNSQNPCHPWIMLIGRMLFIERFGFCKLI